MKRTLGILGLGFCLTTASHGASLLGGVADADMADGSVDGWSGVSAISVPLNNGGGQGDEIQVTEFSFFAAAGRADGSRSVQPLILARPIGSGPADPAMIMGIGDPVSVTQEGLNNHPFSLLMGTDTLNLADPNYEYLGGFWQWGPTVLMMSTAVWWR